MSITGILIGCVLSASGNPLVDCPKQDPHVWQMKTARPFDNVKACEESASEMVYQLATNIPFRTRIGVPPQTNVLYFQCIDDESGKVVFDSLQHGVDSIGEGDDPEDAPVKTPKGPKEEEFLGTKGTNK